MENNNQMVEAFNKVIADSGIQIELWRDYPAEKWKSKIDTSVHDKQIRAKVLDEIDKILLDRFTCDDLRTDWTNADIREAIHFELEQLKEQKNET